MSYDATKLIKDANDNSRRELIKAIQELREHSAAFEELPYSYLTSIKRSHAFAGLTTTNKELLKFLALFINEKDRCLDPWAYAGGFSSLYTKGIWSGFHRSPEELKDWITLTKGTAHEKGTQYDFVVGFVPFNYKNDPYNPNDPHKYYLSHFLANIKKGIHKKSKVLVTCTKHELELFVKNHQKESGLSIIAMLSIPGYSWTQTSIESYLLWLELGDQEDYFVGELSDEKGRAHAIYNSINLGGTKNILAGYKVPAKKLGTTCRELIKEQSLNRFSKRNGWKVLNLNDLSLNGEPNLAFIYKNGMAIQMDKPKKITLGVGDVSELLKSKKKSTYIFYSIDEKRLNLEFFKYYFEKSDPIVLSKGRRDISFAVPSYDEQCAIVESASKLESLESLVKETEQALFNHNQKLKTLENRVANLTSHENLAFWISSLPFPVSSILRIYIAEDRPDKQVEALLYFFEALTQFLGIVTVSMLSSNEHTANQFKPAWVESDIKRIDWYKRASFGDWIALGRRLRKVIYKEFSLDKTGYNKNLEILGSPAQSFIDLVSNKELYDLLEDANRKRNQWKGHGGITSDEENKVRSKYLRRILEKLRALSQGGLQEIRVLKPVGSNFRKGVYTNSVELLKGNETPFEKDKIESDIPLDEEELYLNIGNYNSPYLLLPFIRYNPDNRAVYYYSSLNNKSKTHWVTYNFPEVSSLDIDMDDSFNDALLKFMKD